MKAKGFTGPWAPKNSGRSTRRQCTRDNGKPKVRFADEAAASLSAAAISADKPHLGPWAPYLCPQCSTWHIGRPRTNPVFNQQARLRWSEQWEIELGARASAILWGENDPSPARRRTMVRRLLASAQMKRLTKTGR